MTSARIALLPVLSNYDRNKRLLDRSGPQESSAGGRTDTAGHYEVPVPRPGVWRVIVKAPGRVPMQYFPLALARSRELPPVTLLPDQSCVIQVADRSGAPALGAAVYAQPSNRSWWSAAATDGWRPASRFGWTGRSGVVTLPRADGELLDITVVPPDRAATVSASEIEHGRFLLPGGPWKRLILEAEDAQGDPVAGALVAIGDIAWPVGQTGADGRLRVLSRAGDVPQVFLLGLHGELSRTRLRVPTSGRGERDGPQLLRLSLAASTTVIGSVHDAATGHSVGGALVWPGNDPGRFEIAGSSGSFSIETAGDARFWVQADADGYLPKLQRILPSGRSIVRQGVRLDRAATLSGRIFGPRETPIPGATVVAGRLARETGGPFRLDRAAARSESDESGRFDLEGLDPSQGYEVQVSRAGFSDWRRELDPVAWRAGHTLEVELSALRGGSGRVLTADGTPVGGALVRLRAGTSETGGPRRPRPVDGGDKPETADPFAAWTDSKGTFEVAHLPGETLELSVFKHGFAPALVENVEVPPGRGALDLGIVHLHRALPLEGTVSDRGGRPIDGASLWVETDKLPRTILLEEIHERSPTTTSDSRGRFTVEGLEAGEKLSLVAAREGYRPSVLDLDVAEGQPPLQVTLQRAAVVDGVVLDSEGAPVPGAVVSLRPAEPAPGVVPESVRDDGGVERSATTRSDGGFRLSGLYPGDVGITASKQGLVASHPKTLHLAEGVAVSDVRIILVRGSVVLGRVTTDAGEPIPSVRVTSGDAAAFTDEDGLFRLEGVGPGKEVLEAWHERFGLVRKGVEVLPGDNTIDLVMRGGHDVSGWTADTQAEPVAGVRLTLIPEQARAPRSYRTSSGPDGGFRFEEVLDGRYRLETAKAGYVLADIPPVLEVAGSRIDDLKVELSSGVTLTGDILGLDLSELSRVSVRASNEERPRRIGRIFADGRYEVPDLAPGVWTVKAALAGAERQVTRKISISDGDVEIRRDLDFSAGVRLTGLVSFEGEGLPGALVSLSSTEHDSARTVRTNALGRFQVSNLAEGHYRLTVSHRRLHLIHNEEIEIVGDQDIEVHIDAVTVRGEVIDGSTGNPIGDAVVVLGQVAGPATSEPVSETTVATDAQGTFSIQHLSAALYRASVSRDGYAPAEETLDLRYVSSAPDLRFELRPTQGLLVVPRLASGAVPSWAQIRLTDVSGAPVVEKSYAVVDGTARVTTAPSGELLVSVASPGGAMVSRMVTVPGRALELALPPAGEIEVRVPDLAETGTGGVAEAFGPSGSPLVALEGGTGRFLSSWSVHDGRALMVGVPVGEWSIRVTGRNGSVWTGRVSVEAGVRALVTLR